MIPNKREDGSNFPLLAEFRHNAGLKQHLGNWGTYAAAAGAALAMSTNASADIVYSGETVTASVTPGGGSSIKPFTVAGLHELLEVQNLIGPSNKSGIAVVVDTNTAGPPDLQFFRAQSNGDFVGKNYNLGQLVNGADTASHGPSAVFRQHSTIGGRTINDAGAWGPGTVTSFLGFKVNGGPLAGDLGWLKVKVSDVGSPGYPNYAEVLGSAYETTGAPIPTPEPAGVALGLLAIGAAGILAFRKRRNELAAK